MFFCVFFLFFWPKPLFLLCFQQNMQNLKKHKKEKKKTLFVSTPVLTALVKMSFFVHFSFLFFFAISKMFRDVFW